MTVEENCLQRVRGVAFIEPCPNCGTGPCRNAEGSGLPLPNTPLIQPDAVVKCNQLLAASGQPYPRTCQQCGFGPCQSHEALTDYLANTSQQAGGSSVTVQADTPEAASGEAAKPVWDVVNKAQHYNEHPSGIELIHIVRCLNFNMGHVIKYIARRHGKEYDRSLRSAGYYVKDQHQTRNQSVVNTKVFTLLEEYAKADPEPQARALYRTIALYLKSPTDSYLEIILDGLEGIRKSGV